MLDEQSQVVCCPRCGCNGVDRIGGDGAVDVLRCGYCQAKFEFARHNDLDREPMAIYARTICPHCGSSKTKVTHRAGGPQNVRYHQCGDCELPFKSRELGS